MLCVKHHQVELSPMTVLLCTLLHFTELDEFLDEFLTIEWSQMKHCGIPRPEAAQLCVESPRTFHGKIYHGGEQNCFVQVVNGGYYHQRSRKAA